MTGARLPRVPFVDGGESLAKAGLQPPPGCEDTAGTVGGNCAWAFIASSSFRDSPIS
jgi:hypothetical protein